MTWVQTYCRPKKKHVHVVGFFEQHMSGTTITYICFLCNIKFKNYQHTYVIWKLLYQTIICCLISKKINCRIRKIICRFFFFIINCVSYKKNYMSFSIKRHIDTRVIVRWCNNRRHPNRQWGSALCQQSRGVLAPSSLRGLLQVAGHINAQCLFSSLSSIVHCRLDLIRQRRPDTLVWHYI